MATIEKKLFPEEAELREKEQELKDLKGVLSKKELELATLAGELTAFNVRYLRTVGAKFAELDGILYEIAEFMANIYPEDVQAKEEAGAAKAKADESCQAADLGADDIKAEKFVPTQELKDLYRKLAKMIHPDLADDEEERKTRNEVMAEVNKAYSEGNYERLQEMTVQWERSPEQIKGEDVGAKLVRTIRMISRVKTRLSAIESEISLLLGSNLHQLKQRVSDAREKGSDLLVEMVQDLDRQIDEARKQLKDLKTKHG